MGRVLRAQTQALLLGFLMLHLLSSHPRETSWVIFSILIWHPLPPQDHHHRSPLVCRWVLWIFLEGDWIAWYIYIFKCICMYGCWMDTLLWETSKTVFCPFISIYFYILPFLKLTFKRFLSSWPCVLSLFNAAPADGRWVWAGNYKEGEYTIYK